MKKTRSSSEKYEQNEKPIDIKRISTRQSSKSNAQIPKKKKKKPTNGTDSKKTCFLIFFTKAYLKIRPLSTLSQSSNLYNKNHQKIEENFDLIAKIKKPGLENNYLSPYIDFISGKQDLHFLISIQFKSSLNDELKYYKQKNEKVDNLRLNLVVTQILNGLNTLHSNGIYLGFLNIKNICLDSNANIRISNWGFYQISKYTDEFKKMNLIQPYCKIVILRFDLNSNSFFFFSKGAPEIISNFNKGNLNIEITKECDIWTFGIILLEYCLGNEIPFEKTFKKAVNGEVTNIYFQIFNFINYCKQNENENEIEIEKNEEYEIALKKLKSFPSYVLKIILNSLSKKRVSLEWIISIFEKEEKEIKLSYQFKLSPFLNCLNNEDEFYSKKGIKGGDESAGGGGEGDKLDSFGGGSSNDKIIEDEESIISNYYIEWKKNREPKKFIEDIKKFFPIGKFPILFLISNVYAEKKKILNSNINDDNEDDDDTIGGGRGSGSGSRKEMIKKNNYFFDVASFNINSNSLIEIIDLVKKEKKKDSKLKYEEDEEEFERQQESVSFSGSYRSFANFTGDLRKKGLISPPTLTSILKENDSNFEFQKERVMKFRKLLINYPTTKYEIIKESLRGFNSSSSSSSSSGGGNNNNGNNDNRNNDNGIMINIPTVLRGEIWACILNLEKDQEIKKLYDSIDTVTPHSCDRQISVDVPRW